jgi:hypothetical protein
MSWTQNIRLSTIPPVNHSNCKLCDHLRLQSMSNNNPTGINGYGVKNCVFTVFDGHLCLLMAATLDPPDEELSKELHQYAKERLTVPQRLQRLKLEHGLAIQ